MGFNQQDAHNLNRAKDMFGCIGHSTDSDGELLTLFPIAADNYDADADTVLAQALMAAARIDQGMNLWIDVQLPHIPDFVVRAITSCGAFGMRLVVTHNGACSHRPGTPLSNGIIDAIVRASAPGKVWHPISKQMVPSIK